MPTPADDFDQIIKGLAMNAPTESIDQNPYGHPPHTQKAGLTTRGKAALGIGAAVIAGGTLTGYLVHSASVAASNAKSQEIALKSQEIELAKLKEVNRAAEIDHKTVSSQAKALQTSVDACVHDHAGQADRFGSPSYRGVISDCQAQYSTLATDDGMKATAADATNAGKDSGGMNQGLLLGGGALVVFLAVAAKKGTRSNPA